MFTFLEALAQTLKCFGIDWPLLVGLLNLIPPVWILRRRYGKAS